MKIIIAFLTFFLVNTCLGQDSTTSVNNLANSTIIKKKQARNYYQMGVRYKDGNGVEMDYYKAFEYFDKAASLGDPQSLYAKAYLLYKGLGCEQDYNTAASLFKEGALKGRDNSMYFYALCLRNGYGTTQNLDSAKFWLDSSAALGYQQAIRELSTNSPENKADSAKELLQTIHNLAFPVIVPLNTFIKIPAKVSSKELFNGRYKGYLIQYDWSGSRVIDTKNMELQLSNDGFRISGEWIEGSKDSFAFSGRMQGDSMVFDPLVHGRRDHYSPHDEIPYQLKNATLSVEQANNIVYLAGNINMFSPQRKEPSKPIIIALSRNIDDKPIETIFTFDRVYPNPFQYLLDVNFSMAKDAKVSITVTNASGQRVYLKPEQRLYAGRYSYRLQLNPGMPPGMYFLQIMVDEKMYSYKLSHF